MFKGAGYATCAVGRLDMVTADDWHDPAAIHKYVDRYLGSTGHKGPGNYFKAVRNTDFFRDGKPYELPAEGHYKTDMITDFAVDFIDEAAKGDKPFFLYVAQYAPHWPLHAKPEDIAKYRELYRKLGWDEARRRRHARLIESGLIPPKTKFAAARSLAPCRGTMRRTKIGRPNGWPCSPPRSIRSIKASAASSRRSTKAKVDDRTLVMFLSDNGASDTGGGANLDKPGRTWRVDGTPTRGGNKPTIMPGGADTFVTAGPAWSSLSNTPFRGHKNGNFEGGIATPLVVRWPGKIAKPGTIVRTSRRHITDILATCLDAAGIAYPKGYPDRKVLPAAGMSLLPLLRGESLASPRILCWATSGSRAVRQGDWKLVAAPKGPWQLFNLAVDRAETKNLIEEQPDRAAAMAREFDEWRSNSAQ